MPDIIDELIDQFAYADLFSNHLAHKAVDEILSLRERIADLEAEVKRLETLASQ